MKVFKLFTIIIFLFPFFQCKKDKKIETFEYLMENGRYSLKLNDQFGGDSYANYNLSENYFYACYNSLTCCKDRKAGTLFKNANGSINLASLQIKGLTEASPCIFRNDSYGGDTMITKFNNVTTFIDKDSHVALKGDFVILMYNSYPAKELFGTFEMGLVK